MYPHERSLVKRLKDKPFALIGINSDEDKEKLRPRMVEENTPGKTHEVNLLDELFLELGSIYLMDRGYLDYARLYTINEAHAFFVIRAKKNLKFRRHSSSPVDKTTGLRSDQTGVLIGYC